MDPTGLRDPKGSWDPRGLQATVGEFKVEVIFSRGAPRGDPQGGVPRGGSPGMFQGAVRASHRAKKSKDKTPRVFFHAAFDFDTPGP